MSREERR